MLFAKKTKNFYQYCGDGRIKTILSELVRFKIYIPCIRFKEFFRDLSYGIDTEGIVELPQVGIAKDIGSRQEATPTLHISEIIQGLGVISNDVFIDMGSGKGRVMLIAGSYPFKRIIGVDVSEKLNKICARNIFKMKSKLRCKEFVNVTSNAADYNIPDDATVIFFFNPFGIEVMNKVIEQIKESVDRYPRRVIIVYYNPKYEIEFEQIQGLRKTREINWNNFGLYRSRCVLYEIIGVK